MKTWNQYKQFVKNVNSIEHENLEQIEEQATIISAIIQQRSEMGLSQRDLASICGIPQSSIARIESYKTTPNLNTLLKIMRPLGLKITISK